ncbi:uncharacterized protein LOC132031632 [Lycium ferocissimum]|uniref:uncharacterized protein LOC132031632 n=1 Tax=Lycium ferocissimum TaxID=112874 RepID=UPI002815A7B9|nr:uncharacterized protein LOC132031632 [Lycium ferocissimum]
MEVYIDDMLVKFLETEDYLKHLQETFDILRKHSMKLNPEKCAFGVRSDKFLCFMVSNRGIEINPDKIKAIKDIKVVNNMKANNEVDALANLGLSVGAEEFNSGTVVQLMNSAVKNGHAKINAMSLTWDWRNKYMDYLRDGKLPTNSKESRFLRTKATRFCLIDGQLYHRSFYEPLAKCLGPGEINYVMREVTKGLVATIREPKLWSERKSEQDTTGTR